MATTDSEIVPSGAVADWEGSEGRRYRATRFDGDFIKPIAPIRDSWEAAAIDWLIVRSYRSSVEGA